MRKLYYHINRWGWAIKNYWIFSLRMKPYDYAFILEMMLHQIKILDRHMKRDAISEDHDEVERERVIELLTRLNDDAYDYGASDWREIEIQENKDWNEMFLLLHDHMRNWWD